MAFRLRTRYQKHVGQWSSCQKCPLWESRTRVVLARGIVPATVAFVGEAPGPSEDVIGKPFVGPAGKLLDQFIEEASRGLPPIRMAFTNLVGCIPRGDNGDKFTEPPKASIHACAPRVTEFLAICKPKLIVAVGKLAKKWTPDATVGIVHPAAILRADVSQSGLMIQRTIVTLRDAFEEL